MISFVDSTNPAAVPAKTFSHVAGYGTGKYTWADATFEEYQRYIKIAVFSGDSSQAKIARCLDVERFDATPADAPEFIQARHHLGHDDAMIYCSLSTVPDVVDACAHIQTPWTLWVAWWWQKPVPPTGFEVIQELFHVYDCDLPGGRLAACQWQPGGPFDLNVLYGRDRFTPGKQAAIAS